MDNLLLMMIVLVSLIMNGAMAWLIFGAGPTNRGQTTMTEIAKLLDRFDDLDMLPPAKNTSMAPAQGRPTGRQQLQTRRFMLRVVNG